MKLPDRQTLPAQIIAGTASQDDVDWAKRRCLALEEDRPVFGLTPDEAAELDALRNALAVAHG